MSIPHAAAPPASGAGPARVPHHRARRCRAACFRRPGVACRALRTSRNSPAVPSSPKFLAASSRSRRASRSRNRPISWDNAPACSGQVRVRQSKFLVPGPLQQGLQRPGIARLVEVALEFFRVKIRPRGRVVYYGRSKLVKAMGLQIKWARSSRFSEASTGWLTKRQKLLFRMPFHARVPRRAAAPPAAAPSGRRLAPGAKGARPGRWPWKRPPARAGGAKPWQNAAGDLLAIAFLDRPVGDPAGYAPPAAAAGRPGVPACRAGRAAVPGPRSRPPAGGPGQGRRHGRLAARRTRLSGSSPGGEQREAQGLARRQQRQRPLDRPRRRPFAGRIAVEADDRLGRQAPQLQDLLLGQRGA